MINVFDDSDQCIKTCEVPEQISGYEYEFEEAIRLIKENKTESESMPLSETVRIMEIMDAIRRDWGLVYPKESE